MNAEEFNAMFEVGVPVFAYPDARPEDDPRDVRLVTRTRSKAEVLGGHTDVVWVDGHGACINLTHVDVVGEDEYDAALLADAVAKQGALPVPVGPPNRSLGLLQMVVAASDATTQATAAVADATGLLATLRPDPAIAALAATADDRMRGIYIDGKGDGWIDLAVDPETGERDLTGITNPWKIASAQDIRDDTGSLTLIGRCW